MPSGNDFAAVAGGWGHSLALKEDGSLVAWGWNDLGQCNVPSGSFAAVAGGWHYSLALTPEPATLSLLALGGLLLLRRRQK